MTRVQRIQLRQSELRSKLAAELDKPEAERTEGELERLTNQLNGLETEFRAALAAEEADEPAEEEETTPEDNRLVELREQVDFGNYIAAALSGAGVRSGAELEYNQAMGLREDYFDLALLADVNDEIETRAKRDGDASTNQRSWIDRVFSNTAAAHLGVTMQSVDPGVVAVPVTSAGGTPVQRGRGEEVSESTYTVGVTEIKPSRAAIHGVYSIEDDLRLPGLSMAIERDMRMAMTERIDRSIFQGDTGANEAGADITGLKDASIGETTLTQGNKVKADKTLEVFVNQVDGIYAGSIMDMNVVASVGSYKLWENTIANSAAENQTVAAFLRTAGLSWRTRGHISSGSGNNNMGGYIGLTNGISGAAIAAVWRGAQLIRDPYAGATKGEVELTMNYFWNLALPRAANFKRWKYVS